MNMSKLPILYVEDDEINGFVLQAMLRDHYAVTVVVSPAQALSAVAETAYPLILMDINLGEDEIDGVELARRIRALPAYADIPIFAVTAFAMPGDEERFLAHGFDRYFAKPVQKADILQGIAQYLDHSAA